MAGAREVTRERRLEGLLVDLLITGRQVLRRPKETPPRDAFKRACDRAQAALKGDLPDHIPAPPAPIPATARLPYRDD